MWVNGRLAQQQFGTGQIGAVGVRFARIHRIIRPAPLLRPFQFAVPIRTFDQSHCQPGATLAAQIGNAGNDPGRAFLVSLHRQPQPVPSSQLFVQHQLAEQIQRQLQALGLFAVYGKRNIGTPGGQRQLVHQRCQFGMYPLPLQGFEARMQG